MVLIGLGSKDYRNPMLALTNMTSNATGQPPLNGPHRPGEQRLSQPDAGPDYRKCINCGLTKPLEDFKPFRGTSYVLRCIACRERQRQTTSSALHVVISPSLPELPLPTMTITARQFSIAEATMQQARRDQVAISRAHRVQARDDLQPSPSQTPPLPDIMRGRQELDALHRRHEEERLAGASPSSTPAMREHLGRQRGRALSPSPSSPFSPRSSSLRSPSVASQTISMVESLGSDYQPSSFGVARI
ncbi:uncharacterized protein CPUR_03914 [Claviceps purpurea 20.1]|uniref:Uncharacterized protein n=1 Tax=Claviceps purpurea (strain 20.1) TaxID=1111077 RepID=M1W0U6_CLAP2|nr:uncharacterized protein CPUR_03914 [Claviceps purpurea 20.1]